MSLNQLSFIQCVLFTSAEKRLGARVWIIASIGSGVDVKELLAAWYFQNRQPEGIRHNTVSTPLLSA